MVCQDGWIMCKFEKVFVVSQRCMNGWMDGVSLR